MVKRKSNCPTKLDKSVSGQLSWVMKDTFIVPQADSLKDSDTNNYEIIEEQAGSSSSKTDEENTNLTSRSFSTNKSKKRKRQKIDDDLKLLIYDCDFYVCVNREECNGSDYVCEFGTFSFEILGDNLVEFPQTAQFWIYVNQAADRSLLYFEFEDLEDAQRSEEMRKTKHYFINLNTIPYSVLHVFKWRKRFVLYLDHYDLSAGKVYIKVKLKKASFVDLPVAYQTLTGGIRQDVQTIVKYFYGISAQDSLSNGLRSVHNVNSLYNSIKKIHGLDNDLVEFNVQHPFLKLKLRPYQVKAVHWMLKKEKYSKEALSANDLLTTKKSHPLFEELELKNGLIVYYNRYGGFFVKEKPLSSPCALGGILADEMGLGKTIEVLSCILCHSRPKIEYDVAYENLSNSNDQAHSKRELYFECICGEISSDGSCKTVINCVNCGLGQHASCVKYDADNENKRPYFCPYCLSNQKPLPSRATLIVCPVSILHQWIDEINKHIHSNNLQLIVYSGVTAMGFVQPATLADNDIVLVTYATLKKELSYVDIPHVNAENNRHFRHPKRFKAIPSPMVAVEWWRICLDEAQMVESPTAKTAEMALRLSAINRWCITGTPIQKNMNDLYGLFLFLGIEPYSVKLWWNECLLKPYQNGKKDFFHNVVANVLWRTSKEDVLDQINIPSQEDRLHWLSFSPVEEHFYRMQHVACSNDMITMLNKFTDDDLRLNSLDRHELSKLLFPFLRLRQACCHPQAVRGQMLPINKNTMTMEKLLESLIQSAKMDCERAHRGLIHSLNGLAAVCIIKEEWVEAVDKYREVLRSVEEMRPFIKTDKLQRIHTLHNLNELLVAGHQGISPTLRDDSLTSEAEEIRKAFLEKFRQKVQDSRIVLKNATNAIQEPFQKLNQTNPWWMDILNWFLNSGREIDLIQRIQADLISQTNYSDSTFKARFNNINGLSYIITRYLDDLSKARSSLSQAVQKLDDYPSDNIIRDTVDCHLRPLKKPSKKCIYCQVDLLFNRYESRLFSITEERPGGDPGEDGENLLGPLRRGNWADSEVEKLLKVILANGKNQNIDSRWIDDGLLHVKIFEAFKKEFRGLRGVWMQLRDQASAIDELSQATIRLSVRYEEKSKDEAVDLATIAYSEVEQQRAHFQTSISVERNEMQKKLGQLHYLTNLSKSDYGKRGASNPEPCPICQHPLGEKWTVFICGHCFCMECLQVLMSTTCRFVGRRWNLKCPVCRQLTRDIEISYVSTKSEEAHDEQINVKGSHSTKIEAVIRQLLKIQNEDSTAKSIVFSTWQNVLDVLMNAMDENGIKYTILCRGKKFQANLELYKNSPDINVLISLVQFGSNGLNLIEATHVLLVEPILNPACEWQAIGRIHRIGQIKPTFVHRFVVRGTIEERMHNTFKFHSSDFSNKYSTDENFVTVSNLKEIFLTEPSQNAVLN